MLSGAHLFYWEKKSIKEIIRVLNSNKTFETIHKSYNVFKKNVLEQIALHLIKFTLRIKTSFKDP